MVTTRSTATRAPQLGSDAVDHFLDAIAKGDGVPVELLASGAVLDATVPGWRFNSMGADTVAGQYGTWFADPATFDEFERLPVDSGEVVTYLLSWSEHGVPHAGLLAQMAAANDAG